jgi:hypothetical protein
MSALRARDAGLMRMRVASRGAAMLLALVLAGCSGSDGRLRLLGIERPLFEAPELVLSLELPAQVREGLSRGVALVFRLELHHRRGRHVSWRELRFLPLTRQYQVREAGTGYSRGYGTRAAALAALERWRLPGDVEGDVTARVRLDRTRLPAPLVLAALFDADWRLDSGTTTWPIAPP